MSIYDYTMTNVDGDSVSLDSFKGKVVLIVNTASKCGLTPQYEGLEALYNKYKDQGLVILGFPSNQFAGQEPGSDSDVKQFCSLNFGVSFPLFSKTVVRGQEAHPLFKELESALPFEGFDLTNDFAKQIHGALESNFPEILEGNGIKWNFNKYLIDQKGQPVKRFEPYVVPEDLDEDIQKLLNQSN